jgi:hypothetical protein
MEIASEKYSVHSGYLEELRKNKNSSFNIAELLTRKSPNRM